ncbi:MAG: archaeosortase/exosortase family protein, partial [Cyanobacteria bacterium P01_F01_bin.42]
MAINLQSSMYLNGADVINGFIASAAVIVLLWQKRRYFIFKEHLISFLCGLLLLSMIIYKQLTPVYEYSFYNLAPFGSYFSLILISVGFTGLKKYKIELLILGLTSGLPEFISSWASIAPITIKFSGYLMWYLGFTVVNRGGIIYLPNGAIE